MVPGTPLVVLSVIPPFTEYHLIDLDERKTDYLRAIVGERPDVFVYTEDCNEVLTTRILPNVRFEQYKRGLCLLDPYGLHLDWEVVRMAGETKAVEIFLNFPVADMNRNDSWRKIAYTPIPTLFGGPVEMKTADNRMIADAYRRRLKEVARFKYVPEPIPMRNSKNAVVYYLFFASPNATGAKIVGEIFERYRNYGVR
jgi:three-Cys-motif partner protein